MGYFINENDEPNGKRITLAIIGSIIGIILLVNIIISIRTVSAGNVGIVTRFGNVERIQTSGLAFTIPFIENMTTMEVRIQKEEQTATAATKDLQDVNSTLAVNFALDNESALRVYKELGEDYIGRVITPSIQEVFKSVSAKFTASELITSRPEVKKLVVDEISIRLEKYGIRVIDVSLTNFSFSVAFNQAIEAVQVANQNIAKARQELETTKIEAEKAISKAMGDAEAQRVQQSTLTQAMIQKMAIEKWDGKMPTTISGDTGTILSIPIK